MYPVTVFFASSPCFLGDGEIAPTFVKNWSLVEFVCMALAAKLPLEPLQRSCIGALSSRLRRSLHVQLSRLLDAR